ncbi:MAG: hypothetical protein A2Z75_02250 [Chloroflexi bacterium RBG_13_50_10]|nr:MAG: hypothetical protein A2Z75_02250 [Chloroflexi bacterium RBG_13_50_10]
MPRHRPARSRFSWPKFFLVIFVIACVLAIIWTGYLLYMHRLSEIPAIIILAVAIAVLVWNISLLRRHKIGVGIVFTVFVVTALLSATVCAFSGIEPLASVKQKLTASVENFASQIKPKLLPASEYPAQISGRVVIAEKIVAYYKPAQTPTRMELTPPEGSIWWVIDISVKNIAYKEEISASYDRWAIEADNQVYYAKPYLDIIPASYPLNVLTGQAGQTTFRFLVPDSLKIGETKLVYQGSEAVSYGTLSGGEKVPLYDWDSRTVIREPFEDYVVADKHRQLRTIANWQGSERIPIRFNASKSPWVVNWGYEKVSAIETVFDIVVIDEADYDAAVAQYGTAWPWGLVFAHDLWVRDKYGSIIVPRAGRFVIMVEASGVNWWVKVGVE